MIDKNFLAEACDNLFKSETGGKTEAAIHSAISEFSMFDTLKGGVIVGFSGGADSVLLLIFLRNLRKNIDFKLKAIHINHMIRGDDADGDENFCREFCDILGIEFSAYKIDVPKIAAETKIGTEEAARNERYKIFAQIAGNEKFTAIATAHNATDNLETVIFNLMRGTGLSGLCGISPVRGNIIRPLIGLPKSDITKILSDAKIPFVIDKTNFSTEYTRNYIRHEILPSLYRLSQSPEISCKKATDSLRVDDNYITLQAENIYVKNENDGKIEAEFLKSLHPALSSRIIRIMAKKKSGILPEKIHIAKIFELLPINNTFEVALPGGISFFRDRDFCYISDTEKTVSSFKETVFLKEGFNEIPELSIAISISDNKIKDFSSNVYKISIQADLQSAIIYDRLYVRTRRDGDSYFYGGMTRKVKKLFSDKKIPNDKRDLIPLICDSKGIVWIPGFGVRNDTEKSNTDKEKIHKWVTVYEKYK